ncbi:MAG: hypothetical protein JWM83_2509 [Candidatus Angelobacter sp.]|jgi:hypothetical protein|nr:hypothetical protein [Candidatus Angelobacter sp.]
MAPSSVLMGVRFRTAHCVSEHRKSGTEGIKIEFVPLLSSSYTGCWFGTKRAISDGATGSGHLKAVTFLRVDAVP